MFMNIRSVRHVLVISLLFLLALSLPTSAVAQGGPTLNFGEPQLGQVTTPQGTSFVFQAEAGESIALEVAGINNFLPTISIQDPALAVVAQELNVTQQSTLTLQATLNATGLHTVTVAGVSGAVGQFSIVLNRALPVGLPLNPTEPTEGVIAPTFTEVYYDVPLNPTQNTELEVRSLTEGYTPWVTVYDASGSPIATLTSQALLAVKLEFGPSTDIYKVKVEIGDFTDQATFQVNARAITADETPDSGPVATQEPSDTGSAPPATGGCQVTPVNPNTNVRSGGSTDYPVVATLQPTDNFLVTGFNSANGGWFEIQLPTGGAAWVASFVVTQTGDCSSVPAATYPPLDNSGGGPAETQEPGEPTTTATATPTAPTGDTGGNNPTATFTPTPTVTSTPTTAVQVAPPDQQQVTVQVSANPNSQNTVATVSDVISYPGGDTADRIRYEVIDFSQAVFAAEVLITITCTGPGAENALVSSNFGRNGPQQPCNGYSRTQRHTNDSDFGNLEIYLESGNNALVNYTVVITNIGN